MSKRGGHCGVHGCREKAKWRSGMSKLPYCDKHKKALGGEGWERIKASD